MSRKLSTVFTPALVNAQGDYWDYTIYINPAISPGGLSVDDIEENAIIITDHGSGEYHGWKVVSILSTTPDFAPPFDRAILRIEYIDTETEPTPSLYGGIIMNPVFANSSVGFLTFAEEMNASPGIVQYANILHSKSIDNTFSTNEKDAIINANSPSAANTFATISDITGATSDGMNKAVYDTNDSGIADKAEALDDGSNSVTALQAKSHIIDDPHDYAATDHGDHGLAVHAATLHGTTAQEQLDIANNKIHAESAHAPATAEENVQSDWNQTIDTEDDYIKNKPTIPSTPEEVGAAPAVHDHDADYTNEAYVDAAVAALVSSAPETLDTLNELATALGNDPDFATTVTNQIAGKADSVHSHDDLYYTESETDTLLSSKSDTDHNHDGTYELADAAIQSHITDPHNYLSSDVAVDTKDPTGFLYGSTITIEYDATNRWIVLTGDLTYYWRGEKKSLVSPWTSPQHDDVRDTLYFLHSTDGDNFIWTTAPWDISNLQAAAAYYGTNDEVAIKEAHGIMPYNIHQILHTTIGTFKRSGGDFSDYVLESNIATDRRPTVSNTVIQDEDIYSTLPSVTEGVGAYNVMTLDASGNSVFTDSDDIVPLSTNRPYFNEYSGGTWTQTLMSNNSYMSIWLIAIPTADDANSQKYRFIWVQGQEEGTREDQNNIEPSLLELGSMADMSAEYVYLAQIIIQYTSSDWELTEVIPLSGSRNNVLGTAALQYLSAVTTDGTLTGSGIASLPLGLDATLKANYDTAYTHSQAAHAPADADNTAANETSHDDVLVDSDIGVTVSAQSHNHGDLYYTESEIDTLTAARGTDIELKNYRETVVSTSATSITPILTNGNIIDVDLSGNTTINAPTGEPTGAVASSLTFRFTQDTTARSITWNAVYKFPGGTAPTISTTSGAIDIISFITFDNGATWYGFSGLDFS